MSIPRGRLAILETYLPKLMDRNEVEKIAKIKKDELGITDATKKGMLMSALMKDLKGRADGMVVKEGSIDATIGRILFGIATRTNPAPARSAALPARAAAPLMPILPAIMQTLPKSPLCESVARGFSFGIVFITFI